MFNLRLLQTFKTAVDTGSFASAAKALNYNPSTVSKHINELELEVGASLIIENAIYKGLTPIGEITYNYAVETTARFKDFKSDISTALESKTLIRIGGIERYLAEMIISKVINYQKHKLIQFDLISLTSDETLTLLKNSELDIGLITDRFIPPTFEGIIVKRESLVLVASKKTFSRLTREQIEPESLPILIDKKVNVIFDHVLKNNNRHKNIIQTEGDDLVVRRVRENFCLGVVTDGYLSTDDFHILKVYSEKAPVRLIYPSVIREDKLKEQFLYSLIRHVDNLNLL